MTDAEPQAEAFVEVPGSITFFPTPGSFVGSSVPDFYHDTGDADARDGLNDQTAGQHPASDDIVGSKTFWMPDKFCKVCYDCGTPFSMFKRRHHCRLCGQVFCNTCSAYNVDGKGYGLQGSVRACKYCSKNLAKHHPKANESMKNRLDNQRQRMMNAGKSGPEEFDPLVDPSQSSQSVDDNLPLSLQIKLGMIPPPTANPLHAIPSVDGSEREGGQTQRSKFQERADLIEGLWTEQFDEDSESTATLHKEILARRAELQSRGQQHLRQMIHQLIGRSSVGEFATRDNSRGSRGSGGSGGSTAVQTVEEKKRLWAEMILKLVVRYTIHTMPTMPSHALSIGTEATYTILCTHTLYTL
jgi:hypothetical protein